MTGFHADPAALDGLAVKLADSADEFGAAAGDLETAAGDLGAAAVADALTELTAQWSGRLRAVQTDYATAAAGVRAAARAYRATDADAADALGRARG
jgi:uncharacterized protein YukE